MAVVRDGVDVVSVAPTSSVAFAVQQLSLEKKKLALFRSRASSDLIGPRCTPYSANWVHDTCALAK